MRPWPGISRVSTAPGLRRRPENGWGNMDWAVNNDPWSYPVAVFSVQYGPYGLPYQVGIGSNLRASFMKLVIKRLAWVLSTIQNLIQSDYNSPEHLFRSLRFHSFMVLKNIDQNQAIIVLKMRRIIFFPNTADACQSMHSPALALK